MCTGLGIAAIIAATAAAGGTAYQIKSSDDAAGDAKRAGAKQESDAARLKSEAEAKTAADEQATADAGARASERAKRKKAGGYSDTLLTGPSGLGTSGLNAPAKSLLGL